jgi:hypothetical protein
MKNRYSICVLGILIFICAAILVFSLIDRKDQSKETPVEPLIIQDTENDETNEAEDESITTNTLEESYQYIILEEDGHLLVYYSDNMTVFFDSGILAANLPEAILQKLETGIRFSDEEELYEFLENYSS